MKLKKYLSFSLIFFCSSTMANQIVGWVYDSCTSPKRAVQTSTGNWVFGLSDNNTPSRIGKQYSDDGCLKKLKELMRNTTDIFMGVDMYTFRSYVLAQELIDARNRGVNVVVTMDKDQQVSQRQFAIERGFTPILNLLVDSGIPVLLQRGKAGGISHNKTLFVVQKIGGGSSPVTYSYKYVTGSYNYTDNAETMNRENLVFIDSPITSIEDLNDTYNYISDAGDIEPGNRNLLSAYLDMQQQSSSQNPTSALPQPLNDLLADIGYVTSYTSSSSTSLTVTASPASTQPGIQNNINLLMGSATNATSSGTTNGVPVPGQPVNIGTIDTGDQCS